MRNILTSNLVHIKLPIMNRYLLNMAYIGTKFRGLQKQVPSRLGDDPLTIQGQIEIGLKKLHPVNIPYTFCSSRTDAGVHALHNTMHTDLENSTGSPYNPKSITIALNKYYTKNEIAIRILNTYLVPSSFNCRKAAMSRTYLYRLCIIKTTDYSNVSHIPIEEVNRCTFLCMDTFDVDKLKEAANLFLGLHDFRTFMKRTSVTVDKVSRRVITKLDVTEVDRSCYRKFSLPFCTREDIPDYKFYDFTFTSSGFLHNQVRRTVAALIAVAQGKLTTRDIKFMLQVPSHASWNPLIRTVPAHGLYLCEIVYPESDIQTFKAILEK